MTWTTIHRRGDVLREVIATADARVDGLLPLDVEGVPETFGDELTLLGALHLRWHTRLAGHIEREQLDHSLEPEEAVIAAWRAARAAHPGVRAILDHYRDQPSDPAMAAAVAKATRKEHLLLAVMAGRAGAGDAAAPRVGAELEARARADDPRPGPARHHRGHRGPRGHRCHRAEGLLERIRATLAA